MSRGRSARRRCCGCCRMPSRGPFPAFEDVFDAVHDGQGGARHRADRELDRRVDPPQLRPARRSRAVDRRRGAGAGGPQPAGAAGRPTRGRAARAVASAGAGPVRRIPADAEGVEAIATYDTAGSAKMVRDEGRRDTAAIASAAPAACSASRRSSGVEDFKDNITRFLAVGRDRVPLGAPDKTSVVFTLQERAGRAVQGAERLRAPRHRPDQARIAAGAGPAVGVPVLRRRGGRARGSPVRPRHRASGGVRADSLRTLGSYPRWREPEGPAPDAAAQEARRD